VRRENANKITDEQAGSCLATVKQLKQATCHPWCCILHAFVSLFVISTRACCLHARITHNAHAALFAPPIAHRWNAFHISHHRTLPLCLFPPAHHTAPRALLRAHHIPHTCAPAVQHCAPPRARASVRVALLYTPAHLPFAAFLRLRICRRFAFHCVPRACAHAHRALPPPTRYLRGCCAAAAAPLHRTLCAPLTARCCATCRAHHLLAARFSAAPSRACLHMANYAALPPPLCLAPTPAARTRHGANTHRTTDPYPRHLRSAPYAPRCVYPSYFAPPRFVGSWFFNAPRGHWTPPRDTLLLYTISSLSFIAAPACALKHRRRFACLCRARWTDIVLFGGWVWVGRRDHGNISTAWRSRI